MTVTCAGWTRSPARDFILDRLRETYDVEVGEIWELGGAYHPSPGVTPKTVYPFAVEVRREGPAGRPLWWIPLRTVVDERDAMQDGHLRIIALRAAHALAS